MMTRRTVPRKPNRPKVKPPIPANLPQHNLPEPYATLQTMGFEDEDEPFEEIAETLKARNPEEAAQKLIAMALDETYHAYAPLYPDFSDYMARETRMFAPSHAVRVLTFLGESAYSGIELLLPLLDSEDDLLREELPIYYGTMGLPAIAALTRTLQDAAQEKLRPGAGDSLAEIGEKYPDLRGEVISILEQTLATEQEDEELNGFLICNLLDLGAVESMPLIEQAFNEERVDEFVVALEEVQEHFGLPITASVPSFEGEDDEPDFALPDELPRLSDSGERENFEPIQQPYVAAAKVGRNEPCPCGSGKKYKKCCGS